MRRIVVVCLAAAALAGCLRAGQLDEVPAGDGGPLGYDVTGCRLVEAVVPGDLRATRAALPAGYTPVDYGEYWSGPATGDSAISVVALDCDRYEDDATRRTHAEALFGAYVELPLEHRDPDAGSFYVFDGASTNPVHRANLREVPWPATAADRVVTRGQPGGSVQLEAVGSGWWATIGGTFPGGDTTTGTFAFLNHHVADRGLSVQRLAFQSFSYRTAPVELAVHGVDPVVDLVGDGSAQGIGYDGSEVSFSARVHLDATAR